MSQVDHQAGAYPSVHIMRRLGVFLLPLDGISSPSQGYPQHYICWYPFVHLGQWRDKCLTQEHSTMSQAKIKPALLELETNALIMRPLRLHI